MSVKLKVETATLKWNNKVFCDINVIPMCIVNIVPCILAIIIYVYEIRRPTKGFIVHSFEHCS